MGLTGSMEAVSSAVAQKVAAIMIHFILGYGTVGD
jgi:hypothetical protein